jgi:hypothetical protein
VSKDEPLPIVFYKTSGGDEPVRNWLLSLPGDVRREIGGDVRNVQDGWPLGKPYVDGFGAPWLSEEDTEDSGGRDKACAPAPERGHRIMNRERIGSKLDSMFEDLGEIEEVRILTQKKIIARQLEQARQAGNVSISEMARRMGTSRMAVHSLLDPAKPTMTIDSVSRAAVALGARLEMKVVPSRTPARPPSKPRRKAA